MTTATTTIAASPEKAAAPGPNSGPTAPNGAEELIAKAQKAGLPMTDALRALAAVNPQVFQQLLDAMPAANAEVQKEKLGPSLTTLAGEIGTFSKHLGYMRQDIQDGKTPSDEQWDRLTQVYTALSGAWNAVHRVRTGKGGSSASAGGTGQKRTSDQVRAEAKPEDLAVIDARNAYNNYKAALQRGLGVDSLNEVYEQVPFLPRNVWAVGAYFDLELGVCGNAAIAQSGVDASKDVQDAINRARKTRDEHKAAEKLVPFDYAKARKTK